MMSLKIYLRLRDVLILWIRFMTLDTKTSKFFDMISENYIYGNIEKSKPQTDYPYTYT